MAAFVFSDWHTEAQRGKPSAQSHTEVRQVGLRVWGAQTLPGRLMPVGLELEKPGMAVNASSIRSGQAPEDPQGPGRGDSKARGRGYREACDLSWSEQSIPRWIPGPSHDPGQERTGEAGPVLRSRQGWAGVDLPSQPRWQVPHGGTRPGSSAQVRTSAVTPRSHAVTRKRHREAPRGIKPHAPQTPSHTPRGHQRSP